MVKMKQIVCKERTQIHQKTIDLMTGFFPKSGFLSKITADENDPRL